MEVGAPASEAAAAAKQRANEAFNAGRLVEAYDAYSEGIRAAPSDETLYSNRSATLAKLERFPEALADAKCALSLQPDWGKAYSREYSMVARGGMKNDDILSIATAGAKAPAIRQGFAELSAATRRGASQLVFQNSAGSASVPLAGGDAPHM